MSDASKVLMYKSLDGQNVNFLRNWLLDSTAAAPTVANQNSLKLNTTTNRMEVFTNGALNTVAWTSDLATAMILKGSHDASGGAVPANPTKAGDTWVVSVAGTINGIQGDDVLSVGDVLIATADDPADNTGWLGVQRNINDSAPTAGREVLALAALPADTVTTVTATALSQVDSVSIRLANEEISDAVKITYPAANQVALQSSVALSNLDIRLVGLT